MKELKNPFWRMAAEYGVITLSIWIMVVGIYFFKFPNHFAFGGVTGFSTVVSEATRWSAGDFTFIVNTALLLLGFIFRGHCHPVSYRVIQRGNRYHCHDIKKAHQP